MNRAVRRSTLALVAVGALVLVAGLGAAVLIAGQISRPLARLQSTASRITAGELDTRAEVKGSSEQRSLARAFNLMTERLARLLRSQRQFVADASHQLRTPLTGLRLRIEEAEAAPTREERDLGLAAARDELDRLSHTIDDLLVLSRAGERDLPGERVELPEVARAAAARWQAAAAARDIELKARSGGAVGRVVCAHRHRPRARRADRERACVLARR